MQMAWYIYLVAFKRKQINHGTPPAARPGVEDVMLENGCGLILIFRLIKMA
jgi:hypothetical protein